MNTTSIETAARKSASAPRTDSRAAACPRPSQNLELMVLPDGRILAHNLTPAIAALLAELNPADAAMQARAKGANKSRNKSKMMKPGPGAPVRPKVHGP